MKPGEYKIWGVFIVFALVLVLFLALLPYRVTIEKSGIVSITPRIARAAAPSFTGNWTEAKAAADVTSIVIDKPAEVVADDLLVAVMTTDDPTIMTPPDAQWTQIEHLVSGGKVTHAAWWHSANSSESANYTFYNDSKNEIYIYMLRITGNDTTNPIDVSGNATGDSANATCSSINTTVSDTLILRTFGADHIDITVDGGYPGGHTGITVDRSSGTSGACSGGGAYTTQANPGSTGVAGFDLTAIEEWVALTIAIKPPTCSPNISNTPSSHDFGSVNESDIIETYLDKFNVTNNSGGLINIDIQGTDMVGGDTWTLSDDATPSTNTYGLKAGTSGDGDYVTTVNKTGTIFITNLADSDNTTWGLKIWIPTTFTDGVPKTGTVTLTASCL